MMRRINSKKAQEVKSKIFMPRLSKKAQEEIMGFGIILILIAVILLVFLSISSNKNKNSGLEDYEASSFLKAILEQTTDCGINNQYISVKETIFQCNSKIKCDDGSDSCKVLSQTLKESLDASWDVSNGSSIKGYNFVINSNAGNLMNVTKGIATTSYKGAIQDYARGGDSAEIYIRIYT